MSKDKKTVPDDTTLEKVYDPGAIEREIYQSWEQAGDFAPSGKGAPYSIMIPPPNVTGSLHMGHGFNNTVMDALIRYHRMKGDNTLWQAGSDHAGIATQMVVERQLNADGKTRHDLGREKFIEKVWEWKQHSGNNIARQLRRLGSSLDWSRERFTMDEGLSRAVIEVFVSLYEENLIYRGKRLVNWDPVLHTAVSDLEVVSEEESGHLWHMRYPLADGSGHLIVATTRPETMLGDAAVAVHPDDDRYKKLVGKTVTLPLVNREIPIIADDYVDPEFGTGCVKITPAHDFNDYEMGQRHKLPLINVLDHNACILDAITVDNLPGHEAHTLELVLPKKYHGLDRYEARDVIVHDLQDLDLMEKIEDHKLMVPRCDRSGAVVEPYLTDQWYVKVGPLAEPAMRAVENGDIKFIPDNWKNTYFEWMNNIQDWCISRQIWWGHQIPAWYDDKGNVYVGRSEKEAREKNKLGDEIKLKQDEDVLDTWFSSALWPFSTQGWPDKTPELKSFYPSSVLVTGFDIIFFWVARMIMMGLKFMKDVPFREVYIHGLVRDSHGHKMSKSKGNVLDPIDLIDGIDLEALVNKRAAGLMQPKMAAKIEKATRKEFPEGIAAYGTDALRFTFAAMASTGRDINFDLGRIEGYRNFCNKLWNAARYVLMNTETYDCGTRGGTVTLSVADKWIISRLQQVEAQVESEISNYRFDHMAQILYSFVWDEYCSWYLELSKVVLTSDESKEAAMRGTRQTLVRVLESVLRLLHPITPYITETIWQKIAPLAGIEGKTIMHQPYPVSDNNKIDNGAIADMQWVMSTIEGVRNIRGEMNIKPSRKIPVFLENTTQSDVQRLEKHGEYLKNLARLESISVLSKGKAAPESATALVGEMKVLVPLAGLIDKGAELKRLEKEIQKLEKELASVQGKLNNENFVSRAPESIVQQEKNRATEIESSLASLGEQRSNIEAMTD
jgi:valyl-tRNA synthetase